MTMRVTLVMIFQVSIIQFVKLRFMDVKIYNPIVKINISVFLINMLKVYTNSHPASHKDTNHSNHIQMRVK